MVDYDSRFDQLEDRMNSHIEALHLQTVEQMDAIKALLKEHYDALAHRLTSEQAERSRDGEALRQEIAAAKNALSTSIDTLANQQTQDMQTVKEQLTALSNDVADEIHIHRSETDKQLEHTWQTLDKDKLSREMLSQLLQKMAGRLLDASE